MEENENQQNIQNNEPNNIENNKQDSYQQNQNNNSNEYQQQENSNNQNKIQEQNNINKNYQNKQKEKTLAENSQGFLPFILKKIPLVSKLFKLQKIYCILGS